MNTDDESGQSQRGLADYLRLLWRRRVLVAAMVVTAVVVASATAARQQREYRARAQVLLTGEDLAGAVTGTPDASTTLQAERRVETLAALARVPDVARRAIAAAGLRGLTAGQLMKSSSIKPQPDADVIVFSVENGNPATASLLATALGEQFLAYRQLRNIRSIDAAQASVERRLRVLNRREGPQQAALYEYLVGKSEQLNTIRALEDASDNVVRNAGAAVQIRPRVKRDAVIAGVVGLMLGIGLVLLAEAFDTRVRTVAELREALGLPVLAQVPRARRSRRDELLMLARPHSGEAEAFRILRMKLDLVNLRQRADGRSARHRLPPKAQTILFVSPGRDAGNSTTVANLAVALARAGRSVALVDCDVRRPALDRLFQRQPSHGLTDVILGTATLDEALEEIPVTGQERPATGASLNGDGAVGSGEGRARNKRGAESGRASRPWPARAPAGVLQVLFGGPRAAGEELLGSETLRGTIAELEMRFEWVLIDAAPILRFGDALALNAVVEGLVVVAPLGVVRRQALSELRRVLEASPAEPLGIVATSAAPVDLGSLWQRRDDHAHPESSRARMART